MNRTTPPVVLNLIIINVIFFMAQNLMPNGLGEQLTQYLGLHYIHSTLFYPFQYITSLFLHGGLSHLFMNMFALWMFGSILEHDLGSKRFLIYYLVTGIGAGLLHGLTLIFELSELKEIVATYGSSLSDADWAAYYQRINVVTVGASGSVFGILLAFGFLHPNDRIMLLIPPIPMKAKYFVMIYGTVELFSGFVDSSTNIAHFAHVGGMLFGWLLLLFWRKKYRPNDYNRY